MTLSPKMAMAPNQKGDTLQYVFLRWQGTMTLVAEKSATQTKTQREKDFGRELYPPS
jgi:hypothetical protein